MGYYLKLLVDASFPILYRMLSDRIGRHFKTVFKLRDGKLCGMILSERYSGSQLSTAAAVAAISTSAAPLALMSTGPAALVVMLREKEDSKVVIEVFSFAGIGGLNRDRLLKQIAYGFPGLLKNLGFKFEILDEVSDFFSRKISSELSNLVLEKAELVLEKDKLKRKESEKGRVKSRVIDQSLPEELKMLSPCPFLESSEFSDIFVCGASKHVYVPISSLSKGEVMKKCVGTSFVSCEYYVKALDMLEMCPFLKRRSIGPLKAMYLCGASKYVDVPFSKIEDEYVTKNCVEDRYLSCSYYMSAINEMERRINELDRKIKEI